MPSSTREVQEAPGRGEIVVEAPTATKALEEVTSRLGSAATIVEASKVMRGGIGGFFAREMVQLRARDASARDASSRDASARDSSVTTTAGGETALQRLLGELSAEVNGQEATFAETLRRHLGGSDEPEPAAEPAPSAAEPTPPAPSAAEPTPPAPSTAEPAPEAAEAPPPLLDLAGAQALPPRPAPHPGWTRERLLRLGLPSALLATWSEPADDLEGLRAFTGLVAPLCRPLPLGPALLAGPRAHRLAAGLGHPTVVAPDVPPQAGSVCARVPDSDDGRAWLAANHGGRWLHLVVGGDRWQRLLLDRPCAVSWAHAGALPDALRVAAELGLPLGYGVDERRGGRVTAADPVELAIGIRDLLAGR